MNSNSCRFCGTHLRRTFCDLGSSPLSNAYLREEDLARAEPFYPLCVMVCDECFLVQLPAVTTPETIFGDYAYFSSYSQGWLEHARRYVEQLVTTRKLNASTQVLEIASNDGYLLQYFLQHGVPVLGVEPAANVAKVAREKGVPTRVAFFGTALAEQLLSEGVSPHLLLGNNVLAHVPDLNDFVQGMKMLLDKNGLITMEFPHLLQLMVNKQFDTIYHEHFSYFSLGTVMRVFAAHGLAIYDVELLPTHGGSLRIYACHDPSEHVPVSERVEQVLNDERGYGLERHSTYEAFEEAVRETKRALLHTLIELKRSGKKVVGYGAPAKGNTLLNYCGVRGDFLEYTVDRSPHKQGRYLPGSRLPIYPPETIFRDKPDYVLVLPWNLQDEITEQMKGIREWGGRFIIPIPHPRIVE